MCMLRNAMCMCMCITVLHIHNTHSISTYICTEIPMQQLPSVVTEWGTVFWLINF